MIELSIDRTIPVPIHLQIKGQIEYGVAYGKLEPGTRLPNVRDMATRLQVSPVTVSTAYASLRKSGILTSTPGRGTYVSESLPFSRPDTETLESLRTAVQAIIRQAKNLGIGQAELQQVMSKLIAEEAWSQPLRLKFVGIYREISEHYVASMRQHLQPTDVIDVITFDDLQAMPSPASAVKGTDFILTLAHRTRGLQGLLPDSDSIIPLQFIPEENTRLALARLEPLSRVAVIATFEEFIPVLKAGVQSFAPHVDVVRAVMSGEYESSDILANCDVVIYGSGSDIARELDRSHLQIIEYRHVPDPSHFIREVLPRLEETRRAKH